MNLTMLYAICLGGVSLLVSSACIIIYVPSIYTFVIFRLLKWFTYPLLIQRRKYWDGVSCLHAMLLFAFVGVNVAFTTVIEIHNSQDIMVRSGKIATLNMIPLFLGSRTSFLANRLGVSLQTYYLVHHWIGRVAIIQGLLHATLTIISHSRLVSGFVVSFLLERWRSLME
jgi:uncharacterized protein involved in response to NO